MVKTHFKVQHRKFQQGRRSLGGVCVLVNEYRRETSNAAGHSQARF